MQVRLQPGRLPAPTWAASDTQTWEGPPGSETHLLEPRLSWFRARALRCELELRCPLYQMR